ncbi:MAG TPA: phosphate ABC transporter permease PstA [Mycobacteriales bacterium]|nr:phosphate ABC transporter permease PstA [Mycobacteriales bacterium]
MSATTLEPPRAVPAPILPEAAEEPRRRLHGVRREAVLAVAGAGAAALALSYLLYFVLLPWTGILGFTVVTWMLFVLLYGLLVSFDSPRTHVTDRIAAVVAHSLAFAMLLALVVVVAFCIRRGASALRHLNFFTSDLATTGPLQPLTSGGVLHAMLGTFVMITIALLLTVPIGLVAALYLSESRSGFARFVRTIVEAMTALPSVIAGLFVYALIITLQDLAGVGEKSGLAAAVALSVMMLPIVIRAADVVLRLVPGNLKEAAAALGAPRWRVVAHVVVPTSRSGLMTAIILGTARGIGETSPVLLTAGYATAVNLDATSGPMVSLPLATFILTRSPEPTQIARGFGAAAVLLILVLLLFALARVLGGRGPGELSPRQQRRAAARSREDLARFDGHAARAAASSSLAVPGTRARSQPLRPRRSRRTSS